MYIYRPCPLCRRTGVFTPLIFPFDPVICPKPPTHVFNPCGHAAAKEVNIYIYKYIYTYMSMLGYIYISIIS
jgi:hypothetical protein